MVMRKEGETSADEPPAPAPANPALRLVLTSVEVHCIRAVACPSTHTPVENWLRTPGEEHRFSPM